MKTFEQYLDEARKVAEEEKEVIEEGKDNVNTSDKQKNPQPDNDANKKAITNPDA